MNREHHGAPPAWSTDRTEEDPHAGEVRFLPYPPTYRHRYWFIDFRSLVRIGEDRHWVYSLLILEGYSRKILAGMAIEHQDLIAVLQLLNAAFLEYGPSGDIAYLYVERGLSQRRVSIWLHEGRLHIAYHETLLARYAYRYDRRARRLREVDRPVLFPTAYASPQLEFWELDDEQWHKIARRPYEWRAAPADRGLRQLALTMAEAV